MNITLEDGADLIGDTIAVAASSELKVWTQDRTLLVVLPAHARAWFDWARVDDGKYAWVLRGLVTHGPAHS
jgi:hypothetical protein